MKELQRTTEDIARQFAARAGGALQGFTAEGRRRKLRDRERRLRALTRIARRLMLAAIAIALAGVAWGLVVAPLGIMGVMAVALTIALAWIAIVSLSNTPAPTPQQLKASDLPLLPQRTEEWLARQRPALPAPAMRMVDSITLQLEALAPQLATIDAATPLAQQLRKLVGEELPELIQGYRRVPASMRREARDGTAPDAQLIDGLGIVKGELDRMSSEIASGDLTRLATQNRYLELKYRGAGDDPV